MCFHCIVSVKRLRRAQSPNIQKLLEGKIIVYLFRITADLHICLDIGVEKAFPGRQENSGGIAAGAVQQPAVKLEQQRNQSTSLGQFIEHTKRDVWGFINILVHLAVFGGARRLALLGLVLVFVQFVEIVAFHLVVRSGWKGACYQLEVVVVLLYQLVHQGGFFFGPTGYCSYHLLLKWQAYFQMLLVIENQHKIFALNVEFEFTQRVMWFISRDICAFSELRSDTGFICKYHLMIKQLLDSKELCVFTVLSA
ncbi:Hypothetical_protein [Hexamita inflata]|uniref:Hypothetical_protein n=1 Tax=Hexamita inflata TaxID=28002 RepID=A0ABP1L2C6_9EUKA